MKTRFAIATMVATALAAAACSSSPANSSSPPAARAEVQQGSSAEQSKGPQEGAASARCKDLPSAKDLKGWLQAAPGTDGEAGGLFSGKMEWAAVVNRGGEICA